MTVELEHQITTTQTTRYVRTGKVTATRRDVFRFDVTAVPCVPEQAYSATARKRYYDPDLLVVTIGGGYGEGAVAHGPNIKKDGTHGQRRPSRFWPLQNLGSAPDWVREAVSLAILTIAGTAAYESDEDEG